MIIFFLLMDMLTWTSGIQLAKAKGRSYPSDYDEPAEFSEIRHVTSVPEAAYSYQASIKRWPVPTAEPFSQNRLDPRLIETFELSLGARDRWDFSRAHEWGEFACIDDDSAELVIGVNDRDPSSRSRLASLVSLYGGKLVDTISFGDKKAVVIDIPFMETSRFVKDVEAWNLARYVEPNLKVRADFTPNDSDWSKQWGPRKIEADWAWNSTTGNSSILVAIPDSGIDYTHPDLAANYVELGYDWVNNDTDPIDDAGHGTHCAGIIAGIINNNIGVAGIAQVRIMAEKMLDSFGWGTEVNAAKAIVHAVDQGANLISCSWGGIEDVMVMHEAVQYAYDNGVLVIASAGNQAWNLPHYPSWYDEVISVAATDSDDERASFSNWGKTIEVAAPGVDIYSTTPTYPASIGLDLNYDYLSGTSMAGPYVAGVAALIWSQFPSYTHHHVRTQLRRTANDMGEHGFDVYYGYGRINARRAVEDPIPDHDLLISSLETPKALKPCTNGVINTTVVNLGLCNETSVTVQLYTNGLLSETATIDFLVELGGSETVNFTWNQCFEGTYNITSYVVPVANETCTENNANSQDVLVRTPRTFRVPDDYLTIQEAVTATLSGWGDKIIVAPGTYYETVVIQQDDLTVVGEDAENTIIDANYTVETIILPAPWLPINRSLPAVEIYEANNVNISCLTLQHGTRGMSLLNSDSCTLRNITLIDNRGSFGVTGTELSQFIHDVDTSNVVDGKPIYYWINEMDKVVPQDAGYVAVVSSSNITLKDLELVNGYHGALLAYTTDSIIENVTAINNTFGLYLKYCSGVSINGNVVKDSEDMGNYFPAGIYLNESPRNTVTNNRIENRLKGATTTVGVLLRKSNDNIIFNNTSTNPRYVSSERIACGWSIWLHLSNSNRIEENKITGRGGMKRPPFWDLDIEEEGITLWSSTGNTIANNTLSNLSLKGIVLAHRSDCNNVTNNSVTNVEFGPGISTFFSAINCTFSKNTVKDSRSGIVIDLDSRYNMAHDNYFFNNSGNGIGIAGRSRDNMVYANCFVNNTKGITLTDHAKDNVIHDNYFVNQSRGILIKEEACNNTFYHNLLVANSIGVRLVEDASHNIFYHNSFVNNECHASIQATVPNNTAWDSGYPKGGNYWSNYTGVDLYSGPFQNETGSDGVGDDPHIVDDDNVDYYPLINPWRPPDIAVLSVTPSEILGGQGFTPSIDVTVENQADLTENFTVTLYADKNIAVIGDEIIIGEQTVSSLTGGTSTTLTYTWNTTDIPKGDYTISAKAHEILDEVDTADNLKAADSTVTVLSLGHDIAIKTVYSLKTVLGQGFPLTIDITAKNFGSFSEIFNVTVQANTTVIATFADIALASGNSTILTFNWNTTDFSKGNYTITACATSVPSEIDTTDNCAIAESEICITVLGDVDGDFDVDIFDIISIVNCYGSGEGEPEYIANYDIDGDGDIDIFDIVAACGHYGESW